MKDKSFAIVNIILLIIILLVIIFINPNSEKDRSEIDSLSVQNNILLNDIRIKKSIIDSIMEESLKVSVELEKKDSTIKQLKNKLNEKKKDFSNIDDDSAYVFIKRYLSEEYEPLF